MQEQEAENRRLFNELTEAAGELLDLGFEDVYQDTRESLAASLGRCSSFSLSMPLENCAPPKPRADFRSICSSAAFGSMYTAHDGFHWEVAQSTEDPHIEDSFQFGYRGQMDQHKGTYIWHDDGLSARQQHDALDNVTTFKGLPASASRCLHYCCLHGHSSALCSSALCSWPTCCQRAKPIRRQICQHSEAALQLMRSLWRRPGAAEVKEAPPSSGRAGSQGAAAAAGGAVSYHTAVPHSYAAPASTATMLHDSGQRPSAPGAAGSAPLGRPPPAIPKLAPLPPAPSALPFSMPSTNARRYQFCA